MLSNSCQYAIHAILYLAIHSSEENKISVKSISEKTKIPAPFLSKILQGLANKNFVTSSKGPNGGFFLTKKNKEKKLIDIVQAIDGQDRLKNCILGFPKCSDNNPCPLHHTIQPFKEKLISQLQKQSISDYTQSLKNGDYFLLQ